VRSVVRSGAPTRVIRLERSRPRSRAVPILGAMLAVCLAALEILLREGKILRHERIVVFNTGAAQKYPEAVRENLPTLDITRPIEWNSI